MKQTRCYPRLNGLKGFVGLCLVAYAGLAVATVGALVPAQAQSPAAASPAAPSDNFQVYLPFAQGGKAGSPTATPSPTPPVTATPSATPQANRLPANLVGTWFSGNQPLNDFYNPQTGEWRSVSGLGQMYVFADDGSFTYSGFFRIETGACRSEVSVFRQGSAQAQAGTLTLHPMTDKTRTMITCPSPKETIVEGPHQPYNVSWAAGEDNDGRERLTITEGNSETLYAKSGMAASLVGVWKSSQATPQGFYDVASGQFDLNSPMGMWFDFSADARYRFGEHNQTAPDAQGCVNEFWIYQSGTIRVVGGQLTATPELGTLRLKSSCDPDAVSQNPWLDNARTYVWMYRDRSSDVKLVLIPLERYVEFVFTR